MLYMRQQKEVFPPLLAVSSSLTVPIIAAVPIVPCMTSFFSEGCCSAFEMPCIKTTEEEKWTEKENDTLTRPTDTYIEVIGKVFRVAIFITNNL